MSLPSTTEGRAAGKARPALLAAVLVAFAALWLWLDVAVPLQHLGSTGGDFRAYHQAARALAAGVSPYSEPAFIYPPLLPVLLLPLAPLPLATARLVWFAASQFALLGSLWLMLGLLGGDWRARAAVLVTWLVGGTVPENLVLGQLNPFLLLVLVVAMRLTPRRAGASAASIGLAAALKVWPATLLFAWARRRAWRPLAAGVAVTLALVLVPAVVTMALVRDAGALGGDRPLRVGTAAPLNVSLPALALRLCDPPRDGELPQSWIAGTAPGGFEPWARHGWIAASVAALVLVASVAALSIRRWRGRAAAPPSSSAIDVVAEPRHDFALELGALAAAAILAAPVGWYHYQLCQLPAFAIVLDRRLRTQRLRPALVLLLLLAALTRAPAWGFGLYVERFGWTATSPAALWVVTSLGPVLAAVWTGFLIYEARNALDRAVRAA